jgi:hypothetical protein
MLTLFASRSDLPGEPRNLNLKDESNRMIQMLMWLSLEQDGLGLPLYW